MDPKELLALLGRQVNQAQRAVLDLEATEAPLDPWDQPAWTETREIVVYQESWDSREKTVLMDHQDLRDLWVYRDLLDLLDHQESSALEVHRDCQALRDRRDLVDYWDPLV